MQVNIVELIVIGVLVSLAWWANEKLNKVPTLKTVIEVVIVVIGVLWALSSIGVLGSGVPVLTVK